MERATAERTHDHHGHLALDPPESRGWRWIRNILAVLIPFAGFFVWAQAQTGRVTTLENNDVYFKEQLGEMKRSAERDRAEIREDIKEIKRMLQESLGSNKKRGGD